MSFLWKGFVESVQWYWDHALLLPRVALTGVPDVGACLMHQKLQMVRAREGEREVGSDGSLSCLTDP